MLEPFHFFLQKDVLRIELFVRPVDFQRLLDLLLHVVAVLLQLADDLLLCLCPLLRLVLAILQLVFEQLDLGGVTLLHLGEVRLVARVRVPMRYWRAIVPSRVLQSRRLRR